MFYSIPGVLKASLNLKDVDYSDITSLSHADSSQRPSRPFRSQEQAGAEHDASKVSRRTRISFECHPSVLMEDFTDELEQEFGEQLLDFDIVSILERLSLGSKRQ
jgi:hypothetical protein